MGNKFLNESSAWEKINVVFPAWAQEEYGNHNNKWPAYWNKVAEIFWKEIEEKWYTNKTFEYLFNSFSWVPFEIHNFVVYKLLFENNPKFYEDKISLNMFSLIEKNLFLIKRSINQKENNPYWEKFNFDFLEKTGFNDLSLKEEWKKLTFDEKLKLFSSIPKIKWYDWNKNLLSLEAEVINDYHSKRTIEWILEDKNSKFNELSKFSEKLKWITIDWDNHSVKISENNIWKFDLLDWEIAEPLKTFLDNVNKEITITIMWMWWQDWEKVPLLESLVNHKNIENVIVTNSRYIKEILDEDFIILTNWWWNVEEIAKNILPKDRIFTDYDSWKEYINT